MKPTRPTNRLLWDNAIVIYMGIVFAGLFWFLEAAMHSFVFDHGTLFEQLFQPELHELWMRSLVVSSSVALPVALAKSSKASAARTFRPAVRNTRGL